MTPEQLQQLRDKIAANRQPVERPPYVDGKGKGYAHPRGFNDALDCVERWIKELLGEKP